MTVDHSSPRQRVERPTAAATPATGSLGAVNVKNIFYLAIDHWHWFVISLLVAMGVAYYYLLITPKIYTRTASILIKGEERENGSEDVLRELGLRSSSINVSNEISSLTTNTISLEVVKRLHLEVRYLHVTPFQRLVVYGVVCPVTVTFDDLNDNETASLELVLQKDGQVKLSDLVCNGKKHDESFSLHLGGTVKTPIGRITVKPSPYYKNGVSDRLVVERSSLTHEANMVHNRLSVHLRDKNSTILDLSYNDKSIARAEDILNTLVAIHNENGVRDRNQRMVSANAFIKDRLEVIEQELGQVEDVISDYKADNMMTDVNQAGSMAVNQVSAADQQLRQLDDQIYMIHYIRNYLTDGQHNNQLLPTNSGLDGFNLAQQISEYNEVMLRRNNHLANSSAQNPLVIDLNQHLSNLRQSIIQSLDNEHAFLKTQRASIQSNRSQGVSKIASNPGQAKFLLSVERQQKVKESLYLFLLQKREENELSQAFTTNGSKLIELPHGSQKPTEPQPRSVYILALILGLAVPAAVLFVMELLNTTVRGRSDLQSLQLPFAGEIPQMGDRLPKLKKKKSKKRRSPLRPELLVKEGSLDMMNEAFRMLRTNVEFILGFDQRCKVIMLTSSNPGAGKTFIAANLAAALSLKEKRVIALDLDLRRARLSTYVDRPKVGITNYLCGQETDYHSLTVRLDQLDVLPCGTFPPNPTELLYSPRFEQLITSLRSEYDYILIDCPPIDVVADTKIINRWVDMTLFVIRSRLFERAMLPELEQWYEEKTYRNLAMVLNGTLLTKSSYGYHRYGYYGHYGYGEKKK
jgi:capsular exopolysaccharide synthesis family protein